MKTLKYYLLAILILPLFFAACESDEVNSLETVDDESVTDAIYDDVDVLSDDVLGRSLGSAQKTIVADTCPVVTVTLNGENDRSVTVDFGAGCEGKGYRERVRSGKVLIHVTGVYGEEGFKRVVTFDNYYVNGHKVEGTRTVENMGENGSGNIYFNVSLVGGKVTTPSGKVITRESSRVREWIEGMGTKGYVWDDVYSITGTANGVNSNGNNYTATITTPLIAAANCRWLKEGVIEHVVEGGKTYSIDYGAGDQAGAITGNCDPIALVTSEGKNYTVYLWNRR